MKAIIVREHGGYEKLELSEVPDPVAGPGEGGRRVHHGLLVARQDVGQCFGILELGFLRSDFSLDTVASTTHFIPAAKPLFLQRLNAAFRDVTGAAELLWNSASVQARFEEIGAVPLDDCVALARRSSLVRTRCVAVRSA